MEAPPALTREPSISELQKEANHGMPPGRVRHMFKKLDKDKSGGLSLDELKQGFAAEFKVEELAPHVLTIMDEMFAKQAAEGSLKPNIFSRFYCEVLYRHSDADNNGTLELAEVQEALKHMVKPNAEGVQVAPVVAFPPEFTSESGEVHLPLAWFWATFSAME